MSEAGTVTINVIDRDHVLDLLQNLLSWDQPRVKEAAQRFFLPEVVDEERLSKVAQNVRTLGRVALSFEPGSLAQADVVVCRRGGIDDEFLRAAPRLRLVQRLGNSTKGIDVGRLADAGVALSLLPRRSLEHVADHTMLLILSLARRAATLVSAPRLYSGAAGNTGDVAYNWPCIDGIRALEGMTLGIVGYGEIGARLARRARAFGLEVLYAEKTRLSAADERRDGVTYRELDDLLAATDIVSVHVPPIGRTQPLIGAREIALMKKGTFLINTSRGALVDQNALLAALREGRLGGAGLDVFEAEPLSRGNPIFETPNLILTPHVAGGSRVDVLNELECICENIAAVMAGNPPPHARVTA